MSTNLSAVIFDVDGTLADTERDGHRPAFNAAFVEAGIAWQWDEVLYAELLDVTGGKERIKYFASRHDPEFLNSSDLDRRVAQLHASKTRHFVRLLEAGRIPLRPGIAQLINECRAERVRLAIATTTTLENVDTLLRVTLGPAAVNWFDVIGAGDVVRAKKPAADIYHWVLQRLALPAGACLAIEDSTNGLAASIAAGIPTLVTTNGYTLDQNFRGALAVLPDLAAIGLSKARQFHAMAYGQHKKQ